MQQSHHASMPQTVEDDEDEAEDDDDRASAVQPVTVTASRASRKNSQSHIWA